MYYWQTIDGLFLDKKRDEGFTHIVGPFLKTAYLYFLMKNQDNYARSYEEAIELVLKLRDDGRSFAEIRDDCFILDIDEFLKAGYDLLWPKKDSESNV